MFSDGFCSDCFTEMLAMYDIGIRVTHVELSQRLENMKHDKEDISKFLKECVNDCPTSVYVKNYANTIIDDYRARTVRNLFEHISLLPKDINESIAEIIYRCEELSECKDIRSKSISKIVDEQQDKYFLNIEREHVTTGFSKLDDCLICLEGGDVTVIGARPSVGKSAISLQMIEYICGCGKKVGYFNLEMGEEQVFQRLNSRFSKIGITRIRRAKEFLNDEQERYRKANDKMKSLNLIVSAGSKTVSEIKNESRHQKFDVIVIDYLQLIKADRINANRAAEVGYISKSIKELAMELKVPVILLSQLNRVSERSETKEPTMADLRESGDIEQDASNIILLWKMVDDGSMIGLKVDKNRQGGLMKEGLSFVGDTVSFTERGEDFSETLKLAKRTDGFSDAGRTPFD
jgi:replicative DNA helicase